MVVEVVSENPLEFFEEETLEGYSWRTVPSLRVKSFRKKLRKPLQLQVADIYIYIHTHTQLYLFFILIKVYLFIFPQKIKVDLSWAFESNKVTEEKMFPIN